LGRKVEEIDDDKLREVIVYSYRMIYRVVEDGVNILAIIHSKRALTGEMLEEKL